MTKVIRGCMLGPFTAGAGELEGRGQWQHVPTHRGAEWALRSRQIVGEQGQGGGDHIPYHLHQSPSPPKNLSDAYFEQRNLAGG